MSGFGLTRFAMAEAGRVGRWRGGGDPVVVGVSSDWSVSVLSDRCPRIARLDHRAPPFPATPLRTVREVLPHTALPRIVTHRRGRTPVGERSPVIGWISLAGTHPAALLPVRDPAARPSLGRGSVVPALQTVLCPAPTPSGPGPTAAHTAPLLAQEGLSSSVNDCPDIPRPLRRRVLDGCTSQGFTASVAFALESRARLPLVPLPGCVTTLQTSLDAADCQLARPPREGFVSGLRRGDFAPFSIRRRSATRRLGPYRDQTFTGKPNAASLDTHRRSALRQALHRWSQKVGPHPPWLSTARSVSDKGHRVEGAVEHGS